MKLNNKINLESYKYLFSEDKFFSIIDSLQRHNILSKFTHKVFWAMVSDNNIATKNIEIAIIGTISKKHDLR
jgi:hypothetical protein